MTEPTLEIDRTSGITRATLCFLLLGTSSALISILSHSRIHSLSQIMLISSVLFGILAFIKIVNAVAPLMPRPLRNFIHWLHAMLFELLSVLFILPWTSVLGFRKNYTIPTANPGGRPVLLVHGYCNNSSVWFYLKYKLAKQKLGPLYVINLGFRYHSLTNHVQNVKLKCAQIKLETGCNELVLIGHSMGGVVATLCALECVQECAQECVQESADILTVITIASPLAGTKAAKLGKGASAREMEIDSTLMKDLAIRLSSETKIRFFHIGTKTDQLIIPSTSSLPGINLNREFIFEDIGHKSILLSQRTADVLTSWLLN